MLAVAGTHVFFTAGVVFGWASLAEVLANEGAFCNGSDCSGQAGGFALIFTLGTLGNYTSNLPFGVLLDRHGPQLCCVVASLAQLAGALAMVAFSLGSGYGFLAGGFFLLGFGGPGIQMATFHMAHLFPNYSGSLIAGSTALFDAGTAVFAVFYAVTQALPVDLASCWAAYACIVLLWPPVPFEAPAEGDDAPPLKPAAAPAPPLPPPLTQQLTSPPYLYLICFASVHICRLNFVVGTFQEQVGSLGFDDAAVVRFVGLFGAMLPFGFVGMPLIGHLLDRSSPAVVFALVNGVGIATALLLLVPRSTATLCAAMALVAVGRQFVYSTFFASLHRIAGPNSYGLLAGLGNLCVAATGALQPVLTSLSTDYFAPWGLYAFAPVNLLMIAFELLLLTQPLACWQERAAKAAPAAQSPAVSGGGEREGHTHSRGAGAAALRVALLDDPR